VPRTPNRAAIGTLLLGFAVAPAQEPAADTRAPRCAGVVQRDDGGPVEGTRIVAGAFAHPELPPTVAWALGAAAEVRVEAVADARGVFKLALPHAGPFALLAVSADGKRARHHFPVMATDFVTLALLPLSVVAGSVVDATGRAAAGAVVSGASYTGTGISRERYAWSPLPLAATADERGRFRMEVAQSAPDTLSVGARSLRAATPAIWGLDRLYRIDGQSLTEVVLRLDRSRQLAGRVLSAASGQAIAGAEVLEVEEGHGVARTAADGQFVCDHPFGGALVVRAPGHAIRAFVAEAGVCKLAAGAVVRAALRTLEGLGQRRVLLATSDQASIGFHFAWQTSTDAEGRLVVDEARAGAPLYGFVEVEGRFVQFLHVVPGTTPLDLGEVRVGGGRSVNGTVLAIDGLRRAGAMVMLQPALAPERIGALDGGSTVPASLTRITYTDRAGRFRFEGVPRLPQRVAVAAGCDGFRVLELAADADVGNVQLADGAQATLVVRLPDGSPAAGASVQYLRAPDVERGSPGAGSFGTVHLLGQADAQGRCVIRGLVAGSPFTGWAMVARDGAGFISSFSGNAGQTVEVRLAPHDGRL